MKTKRATFFDEDGESVGPVRIMLRQPMKDAPDKVFQAHADSALLFTCTPDQPIAALYMGEEHHLSLLCSIAISTAAENRVLVATLLQVLERDPKTFLQAFAAAVHSLTRRGTDGEAEGSPGGHAGG